MRKEYKMSNVKWEGGKDIRNKKQRDHMQTGHINCIEIFIQKGMHINTYVYRYTYGLIVTK